MKYPLGTRIAICENVIQHLADEGFGPELMAAPGEKGIVLKEPKYNDLGFDCLVKMDSGEEFYVDPDEIMTEKRWDLSH